MENKIKKVNMAVVAIFLGLGLVFTQSAFKQSGNYSYYNTTGVESTNPMDYVFDDRPGNDCNILVETEKCSAVWANSATPIAGSHPDGAKISDEDAPGRYVPGSDL